MQQNNLAMELWGRLINILSNIAYLLGNICKEKLQNISIIRLLIDQFYLGYSLQLEAPT